MPINDEPTFWRVWSRLRTRLPGGHVPLVPYEQRESADAETQQLGYDLAYLLSATQNLPATEQSLREAEGLLEAARRAYEDTEGRTSEKQAAACRALGLTGTTGPKPAHAKVVRLWLDLTRLPNEKERALEKLASELGIAKGSAARELRKALAELECLVETSPESPWAGQWRAYIEALTTEPATIPAQWGE